MKKLLIGVVLMLASSLAASATITIGNPVITSTGSNPSYSGTITSETGRTDSIATGISNGTWIPFVGFFGGAGTFLASWDLTATNNLDFDLSIAATSSASFPRSAINMSNWSVSIIDSANQIITTGSLNSIFNLALAAGDSIKAVVFGSIASNEVKNFRTTLSISNLEVSEVPLPAAVWLFGSVLLGGLAVRRKAAQKRQSALAV